MLLNSCRGCCSTSVGTSGPFCCQRFSNMIGCRIMQERTVWCPDMWSWTDLFVLGLFRVLKDSTVWSSHANTSSTGVEWRMTLRSLNLRCSLNDDDWKLVEHCSRVTALVVLDSDFAEFSSGGKQVRYLCRGQKTAYQQDLKIQSGCKVSEEPF